MASIRDAGQEDKGPMLLALWWTEAGLATVVVGLRFYTRYLMRGIVIEDWLMLLALFLFYAALACSSVLVYYGLGRHEETLTAAEILQVAKWNWIPQPFSIMNLAVVKLSMSFLLLRILGPQARWSKWFLYVNMVLFTTTMIVASIITFVQCDPPRALWEPVPGAKCWDASVQAGYATFGGAYSAFMDFALALLPLGILRGLTMSLKRKIALALLLGAGILSGVFGIVKTTLSNTLAIRTDISWEIVPLYGWAGAEVFINIVCGSVPTLKPLYDRLVHKKPLRTSRAHYEHYDTEHSTEKSNSESKGNVFYGRRNEFRDISAVELNHPGSGLSHDLERFGPREDYTTTVQFNYGHRDDRVGRAL
ncbi:hypothetical protein N8I77_002734 [Diaporthe amygdali]|uniref:Rhodopsin domain-containing protein n=1 Tax=Phomopsis amygdali TaxID=1214568 RepID=A0AAD9STB2_PHOAM|nr:hypothetical protein N8I77_002734 [Diaporthe amygdali]